MNLRKLELKDAPLMLEWMHDESVTEYLQTDFSTKTDEDCRKFISESWNDPENIHLAIVDDNDTYQGTVSLKHITEISAEFAITIRRLAMGKGISKAAMEEMLEIGFERLSLSKIYWCVSPENERAVRFYDKNGYQRISQPRKLLLGGYTPTQIAFYIWYQKTRDGGKTTSKNN